MNQNYYNNMNVQQVVDNIMTNIDTFSNNNSNNYVPINNLTYNPNVFEPYGQEQSNINNMNQMMNNQMSNPQMMNNQMIDNQMMNNQNINQQMMDRQFMNPYKKVNKQHKTLKKKEKFSNTNNKLLSFGSLRQLLIYTVLFIIFSHSKMTDLICKIIPDSISMISNIPCITLKGLIMGILIILLNRLL